MAQPGEARGGVDALLDTGADAGPTGARPAPTCPARCAMA